MKNPFQLKILSVQSTRRDQLQGYRPLLAAFVLIAIVASARAVSPAPDGGYPNANTAEGDQALYSLTTGADNTAVGFNALFSTTTGNSNTSIGFYSLANNTTGNDNTACGQFGLQSNGTGVDNTAIGYNAMFNNTSGNSNIAVGASAGINLTTGSANIDIGSAGLAGESKTIRIGTRQTHRATYIAGISGAPVAGGVNVVIDSSGRLGTIASSERFKEAIKPMQEASASVLSLKPVTFHYKTEIDPDSATQFGLVAEQVEKVNPALVARDDEGRPYTVRYEAVNAMLLNEFLKEHRKVEEQGQKLGSQGRKIAELEAMMRQQQAAINRLRGNVRKHSPAIDAGDEPASE